MKKTLHTQIAETVSSLLYLVGSACIGLGIYELFAVYFPLGLITIASGVATLGLGSVFGLLSEINSKIK